MQRRHLTSPAARHYQLLSRSEFLARAWVQRVQEVNLTSTHADRHMLFTAHPTEGAAGLTPCQSDRQHYPQRHSPKLTQCAILIKDGNHTRVWPVIETTTEAVARSASSSSALYKLTSRTTMPGLADSACRTRSRRGVERPKLTTRTTAATSSDAVTPVWTSGRGATAMARFSGPNKIGTVQTLRRVADIAERYLTNTAKGNHNLDDAASPTWNVQVTRTRQCYHSAPLSGIHS